MYLKSKSVHGLDVLSTSDPDNVLSELLATYRHSNHPSIFLQVLQDFLDAGYEIPLFFLVPSLEILLNKSLKYLIQERDINQ